MKNNKLRFVWVGLALLFSGLSNHLKAQLWERVNELPAVATTALFAEGDALYVAGTNRIYFTHDGGETWDSSSVVDDEVDYLISIVLAGEHLYAGSVVNGIFRSSDHGETWETDNAGLTGPGALSIKGFARRGDSLYVATGGAGVFVKKVSTPSTWSAFNQGLPWQVVESITNVDGTLFAGAGGNATVSLQEPGSAAWTELPFAEFNGSLNFFLGAIPADEVLLAGGSFGLYRSEDSGLTWAHIDSGTGTLETVHFAALGNRIVANLLKPSGLSFLLQTDDQGLSWQQFQPWFTGSEGFSVAVLGNQLYSARTDGLWRISTATPVAEPTGNRAALAQNFPNPFVGETTIPVLLNENTWLEVSVFNAHGQKVRTLWQGERPAGRHEFKLLGGGLPAGMYHCRLSTSAGIQSQAMLKME